MIDVWQYVDLSWTEENIKVLIIAMDKNLRVCLWFFFFFFRYFFLIWDRLSACVNIKQLPMKFKVDTHGRSRTGVFIHLSSGSVKIYMTACPIRSQVLPDKLKFTGDIRQSDLWYVHTKQNKTKQKKTHELNVNYRYQIV